MKTGRTLVEVMAASLVLAAPAFGQAQQGAPAKSKAKSAVVYVTPDKLAYTSRMPKVLAATAWGDPDTGPYSTFTKFEPGFDAGMHTHPNDVSIVVLKGAYVYRDEAGEKRVGPGEFIRIPAGHKHWSGGDAKDGALFYQHGASKFGLTPVK